MVRPRRRQETPTKPVARRPQPRLIGFIGKANVTQQEASALRYIGQCIQELGHTLVIVPAPGAANAVREGVEAQGGEVRIIEAGVLDIANQTLLYPDPTLLTRLEHAYKDLHQNKNVSIIEDGQLDQWVDALNLILDDFGIKRP